MCNECGCDFSIGDGSKEEVVTAWNERAKTEEETYLEKRLKHLWESDFIASFDEVDVNTKEYKRDIKEADQTSDNY